MTIMIGTPAYNGQVTTSYMQSILRLKDAGFDIAVPEYHDSLITRARNSLVAHFLSTPQYTHLFWIDSDIGFTPEQFARLIHKNEMVTAAAYPFKNLMWRDYPVSEEVELYRYVLNLKDPNQTIPEDKFVEVYDAATGFMCIKREALELMVEKYPDLQYQNDVLGGQQDHMYLFFDTMVRDGRYLSEDYAFCRRWNDIGGNIWLDLDSKLHHTGPHTFRGDLLRTNNLHAAKEQVPERPKLLAGDLLPKKKMKVKKADGKQPT